MINDCINEHSESWPYVTVAMPVYNGGEALEYAVRSILRQSFSNWELLIIDDGSVDETVTRISEISDPRIILKSDGQNLGLAARLNESVYMARGKYFARMDHDDICHPDRFARQFAYLEKHPHVDLLATQCLIMNEENEIIGVLPSAINHSEICRYSWRGFYMAHPSWMGRTEWFRKNYYLNPAPYCAEDQELLLRAHYTSCYHTIPEHLLLYRVRGHTPLKKVLKTRLAMNNFQVAHFFSKRNLPNLFFSIATTAFRIIKDLWTEIYSVFAISKKKSFILPLSDKELSAWKSLISELKMSESKLVKTRSKDG